MAQLQTPGNICTFEGCTCWTWQVHVHKLIFAFCFVCCATGSTSGSNDLVKPQKKSSAAQRSECKAQDAGGDAEKSIRRPRTPDEKNVRRRDDAHELEGRKSRGYGAVTTHRRCAIARRRRQAERRRAKTPPSCAAHGATQLKSDRARRQCMLPQDDCALRSVLGHCLSKTWMARWEG